MTVKIALENFISITELFTVFSTREWLFEFGQYWIA